MDIFPVGLVRHLADFGMFTILWLVQLVIYPSFLHIAEEKRVAWHRKYTSRVAYVIVPMMFTQLFCIIWFTYRDGGVLNILSVILVSVCWILTFFVSVPLHEKISRGEGDPLVLKRLIQTNWPRTILWTLIFVIGIVA
ncbi:MAG: hypothetical protein AAF546_06245 [Verrucomicrobiota bacterium]